MSNENLLGNFIENIIHENDAFFLAAVCSILSIYAAAQTSDTGQEKLNLPGDNLNLYAVLKLFQESKTLEGFEKTLNDSTSKINNLDLDGDDKIDYLRVVDKPDGDVHNIILKDAVSKTEDQDVAVFVVQKKQNGQAQIQLIGDEDLYGKDYIIEPNTDVAGNGTETLNPGYTPVVPLANGEEIPVQTTTEYEIASWPVVQYIYVPTYSVWESPWRWNYYPDYWHPWRPHYWHYYYGYQFNYQPYYYGHYRRWHAYRVNDWYGRYYGSNYRSRSVFVQTRYRQGYYNRTYLRPASARNGATAFRRDNPQAPANHALPNFDHAGHPVAIRPAPASQSVRPVRTNPAVTGSGTRPVGGIKPVRPLVTNEQPVKPVREPGIKPVRPVETQENVKPETPVRPVRQEPIVKPVRPLREQAVQPVRPVRESSAQPVRPPVRTNNEVRPATPRPVRSTRENAPGKTRKN